MKEIDWTQVILALIAGVPTSLTVYLTYRARTKQSIELAQQAADQVSDVAQQAAVKVAEVHTLVNDRMDSTLNDVRELKQQVQELGGNPERRAKT